MKRRVLSIFIIASMFCSMLFSLSGCSTTKSPAPGSSGSAVNLTLWGAAEDQKMLSEMVENFRKTHTDKQYKVTIRVNGEDAAKDEALKDIDMAADIFSIAHDQLGALVSAGAVYENTKYVDNIKNEQIEGAVSAAQYDNKFYGYPFSAETYFLYYDKSKLTADDVTSLDKILAKQQEDGVAKLGYDMQDAYFSGAFFITNGCELFGANGSDKNTVTFNNANGLEVGKWLTTLKGRGVINLDGDVAGSQFKAGKLAAYVCGPWKAASYKEALGENYGVAKLPMINFGSGDKEWKSFAGFKMYVVKSTTKYPEEAMLLANYLSNEENQLKRFADRTLLPTNAKVAQHESVTKDPTVKAILEQLPNCVAMPSIPQIGRFWDPTAAFTKDAFDGAIKDNDIQGKLDRLVEDIKS